MPPQTPEWSRRAVIERAVGMVVASWSFACANTEEEYAADTDPPFAWTFAPERFPAGVCAGDPGMTSVVLATESSAAQLTVRVWSRGDVHEQVVEVVDSVAVTVLHGLGPGKQWFYAFLDPDGFRSAIATFRTLPAPWAAPVVRFGATSCLGATGTLRCLEHAAADDLDFFVFLGDTIYGDTCRTLTEYRACWRRQLTDRAGLRAVLETHGAYATWDDHELTNNWARSVPEDRYGAAFRAWTERIPLRPGPGGSGVWRSRRWGRTLELFVLDTRSERGDGRILSDAQMAWLQEGLLDSEAAVKIIASGGPIARFDEVDLTGFPELPFDDRWEAFDQRAALVSFLEEHAITGVISICGDFHFGAVSRWEPDAGPFEVMAGPAASQFNPLAPELRSRLPERQFPVVVTAWNYARFEVAPDGAVRVEFVGDEGNVLAAFDIQT